MSADAPKHRLQSVELDEESLAAAFAALAPATIALATAEGLPAHARSVSVRLNRRD